MDEEVANLIRQLCTRAGMIMEDVSARAICVGAPEADELAAVVSEIEVAAQDIGSIASAARALNKRAARPV